MNIIIDLSKTILQDQQKKAVQVFCKALALMPDHPIRSIVLYGSACRKDYQSGSSDINLLIILERADMKTLKEFIEPVTIGRASRISPLFLTIADLLKLSSAFPLKYFSIRDSHRMLYGDDPLTEINIDHEPLKMRCQQEMLNLLMRLRRNYLNSMGHNLAGFLVASVKGFLEVLRIAVYLKNNNLLTRDETIPAAESVFGADVNVIREIIKIKENQSVPDDNIVQSVYDKYLNLVENIVAKS